MALTIDNVRAICDAITYKPGWVLVAGQVFGQSGLPGYLLQWIVQTALAAVLAAEEHEAREWFRFDGTQPYKPHFDVDDLAWLARSGQVDIRLTEMGEAVLAGAGR